MNITEIQNDAEIWKKKVSNPEVVELISKIRTLENGKTFEVALETPVKSLKSVLQHEFKETNKISVQIKDDTYKTWYVRVDARKAKPSKN